MSSKSGANSKSVGWYRNRVGDPTTDDEARGYWIFALGVVVGIVGILLFLLSTAASDVRQWSIVLAAAGFALLLAGPIIRLPLRQSATWLVYLGLIVCAAAILWFIMAFPRQWNPQSGQPTIIGLYTIGLGLMALGGVFVPVLTAGPERDEALRAREAEVEAAHDDLADTEADEADLAAHLQSLRTSQARFELYQDRGDEWRWRLRHRNGNLIAASGEGYTQLHNAQNGLESVRRNALGATLLLIEREEELPAAAEVFDPVVEVESQATFELYEDRGGEYRWRLVHENGNILADSSEGYTVRRAARDGIDGVRAYVGPADYLRPDPTAFEVYRDRAGEFRWRLVHENGNILADGGGGYSRRHDANRAIDQLRERIDDLEFEVYADAAGKHRWRIRTANDEIIADSGQGYASEEGVESAVERVRGHVPDADVYEIGQAAFEVYEDADGEFRWRLRHRNGNILADSGQGFADRSSAWDSIERMKRHGPAADIEDADD